MFLETVQLIESEGIFRLFHAKKRRCKIVDFLSINIKRTETWFPKYKIICLQIKLDRNQLWWPSGLSRHVSNSSRYRRLGLRFEYPHRITILFVRNWKQFLAINTEKKQDRIVTYFKDWTTRRERGRKGNKFSLSRIWNSDLPSTIRCATNWAIQAWM